MTGAVRSPVIGTSRRTLTLQFRCSAGGAVVAYALDLAVLPFVLQRVGPQLYGVWVAVASVLAVGALADAGVRTEVIRRAGAAMGSGDDDTLVAAVHQGVTLLGGVTAVVVTAGMFGAPAIRRFAFPHAIGGYGPGELDLLIRASVVVLGATLVGNAYFGVLRGVQRGDVEAIAQMAGVTAGALVTVVGVAVGWGLWALFAGSVVQLVVTIACEWVGARRLIPTLTPRLVRISRRVAGAYLALSALALLSQVGDVVDSQWDKLVLSHFVGSAAVTSFQIGTGLVLQGKAVALLVLAPLLVTIAELREADPARMEYLFAFLAKAGTVAASVILSAIFVFAPSFIHLWLGSVPRAGVAARLFVIAVVFNLVGAPLAYRAFGEGWHRLAATASVVNMVVNGGLSFVLVVHLGFNGAMYGSIAGNLLGTAILIAAMRRRLGTRWVALPYRALLVGIAGVGAGVALGIDGVNSWPALVGASAGYALVVGAVCVGVERLDVRLLLRPAR